MLINSSSSKQMWRIRRLWGEGFSLDWFLVGVFFLGSKSLCFRPNHAIFHTHFQASGPSKNHGWDGMDWARGLRGLQHPLWKVHKPYLFQSLFRVNINLKILDPPLNSLQNQLSPRSLLLGCFGRREVCTSTTEIPYWRHKSMFTCKSGNHEFVWCYVLWSSAKELGQQNSNYTTSKAEYIPWTLTNL